MLFSAFVCWLQIPVIAQSSIENSGFENWTNTAVKDSIHHWSTSTNSFASNGVYLNNAYTIGNAQDGAQAIHIETIEYKGDGFSDTIFGYILAHDAPDDFIGFPYSSQIDELHGFYKNNHPPGDSALIIVQLQSNGNIYSYTEHKISGIHTNWTPFSILLNSATGITPDSVFVGFVSSNPFQSTSPQPGSWLEIDNISFSSSTGNIPQDIPNQSFENKSTSTIDLPDGWWSFNEILYLITGTECLTKTTDAYAGNYALQLSTTQEMVDANVIPVLTNGHFNLTNFSIQGGIPFIAQPDQLKGRYKFESPINDSAYILVEMLQNGAVIHTELSFLPTTSFWTPFNVVINLNQAPDSVRLTFYSSEELGANLWLDDLHFFGGDLGQNDLNPTEDFTVYPNPANESITIQLKEKGEVSVYDLTGNLVGSIQANAGTTKINTNLWEAGYYLMMVHTSSKYFTKKFCVQH